MLIFASEVIGGIIMVGIMISMVISDKNFISKIVDVDEAGIKF